MEITINKTKYDIKDIIGDMDKIHKIITNNCEYCKANNIKTDAERLNLILEITNRYFGGSNE